ncbi:DUF6227 family protein [Streptomyces sp. NPDC127084]|uniref:DUF6227 family protein n=1 Tax=Streptomyces sp. NPDC127084 TaxID=3347133 RepID=UPI003649BB74
MNDPYETTETQLERLLGRALNSFDLPDTMVDRLESALAHASSLHSSLHSAGLHRSTYRHTYLLADGSSVTLWELVHNNGRDGVEQHEVYAEETEARVAASRLKAMRPGRSESVSDTGDSAAGPDGPEHPRGGTGGIAGPGSRDDADGDGGPSHSPDSADGAVDDLDADLELLGKLLAGPGAAPPRTYEPDNSPDHARRLLRRAENRDRPGEDTARLLRSAFAHHISQAFGRQCFIGGRGSGFTLYEHAFLLLDGTELSLWEVEHTATPDGRHMCEVYVDERTARGAIELRAARARVR